MTWNQRYKQAYEAYHARQYPTATRDFGVPMVKYPAVSKANGLQTAIKNYLNWQGGNVDRVNTQGRLINANQKQISGVSLQTKKWIPSASRRGHADIKGTFMGKAISIEVKIGADRPSEYQLAEQAREIAAGGIYVFVKTIDEFFEWYDNFLSSAHGSGR